MGRSDIKKKSKNTKKKKKEKKEVRDSKKKYADKLINNLNFIKFKKRGERSRMISRTAIQIRDE